MPTRPTTVAPVPTCHRPCKGSVRRAWSSLLPVALWPVALASGLVSLLELLPTHLAVAIRVGPHDPLPGPLGEFLGSQHTITVGVRPLEQRPRAATLATRPPAFPPFSPHGLAGLLQLLLGHCAVAVGVRAHDALAELLRKLLGRQLTIAVGIEALVQAPPTPPLPAPTLTGGRG